MPYRDYQVPGVNVVITRQSTQAVQNVTEFLPVIIGTGVTARSRNIELEAVRASVTDYPEVALEWDIMGNYNAQLYKETDFELLSLSVHKEIETGTPITALVEGVDYEVVETVVNSTSNGKARTVIRILDETKIEKTDLLYDFTIKAENTDQDFDLRLVGSEDQYYAREIFGPTQLQESGAEFYNDIAIAAEILFREGVERFYYMEVPREYGAPATRDEIIQAYDKVYYKDAAYRIIPLTPDMEAGRSLNTFTTALSNPVDRREIVGFTSYDPTELADMNDIDELVEKVGGYSVSLNNKRVVNVFGGNSVEMVIGSTRYVLPFFFMNVAIAALDSVVGMAEPLSTREIRSFSKLNGPRFRPREWDKLARHGVFIVYQRESGGAITVRHQLTTAQSDEAEMQELSMVKNFDAVTKRLRDRLSPYAGPSNVTDGYMERVDATLTSAIEEVKQMGWARELEVITPWSLRAIANSTGAVTEKRNLVAQFKMTPVYPGNNLDLYLVV